MIGHAPLREIVRADAFGPVAGPDHGLARFGLGPMRFGTAKIVKPGAQHLHRLGPVLVLAPLVLLLHDEAGRQMGNANRGIGRVDVLPARAARPVDVDLQIVVVDLDIDFARFGKHGDGRGGGVDAPPAFGDRHALDTVDAALELQFGENAGPRNIGHDFLEPADFGRIEADRLDPPSLFGGEAFVHAIEIAREQRRFVSARSGADFQHGRFRIRLVTGQHGDREFALLFRQGGSDRGQFLFRHGFHFRIGEHFRQLFDLGAHRFHLARDLGDRFEFGIVAAGLHEGFPFERAGRHPRLDLGEAMGDLVKAFGGDRHELRPTLIEETAKVLEKRHLGPTQ